MNPTGFDYIVEATGSAFVCEDARQFVRRGGTLLVYGVYPETETVRFNPFDLFRREITIKGSFVKSTCFPAPWLISKRQNQGERNRHGRIRPGRLAESPGHAWARKGIKIAVIPPA